MFFQYPGKRTNQTQSLSDCFWIACAVGGFWSYFYCNALVFPVHNFCFRFVWQVSLLLLSVEIEKCSSMHQAIYGGFCAAFDICRRTCRWDKKFPLFFIFACMSSTSRSDKMRFIVGSVCVLCDCDWGKDNKYSGWRWDLVSLYLRSQK